MLFQEALENEGGGEGGDGREGVGYVRPKELSGCCSTQAVYMYTRRRNPCACRPGRGGRKRGERGVGGEATYTGIRTYFLRAAGWLRSLLVLRGMALRREAYGMVLVVS